jgi:hypothetical protein
MKVAFVMVVCAIAAYLLVRCCVLPPEPQIKAITTDPPIIVPTMPSCCTTTVKTEEMTTEAETTVVTTTTVETEPPTIAVEALDYDVPLSVELHLYTLAVCEAYGISPSIIFAMMEVESYYTLDAVGDNGEAIGILQVQPRYHQERADELNVSIYDPKGNILVAIDLLAELLDKYGDYGLAVTAYNRGSTNQVSEYGEKVLSIAYTIENKN